jgi:hydroxymethylglutaryl-CoA reductase
VSSSRITGFYRLSPDERRRTLAELAGIPAEDFAALDPGALSIDIADGMIENVIGVYGLPFALAVNFTIDGSDALVPMAVEEPSVVAAASNAARLARPGGFTTEVSRPVMIGQIQVTHVADVERAAAALRASSCRGSPSAAAARSRWRSGH